MAYIDGKEILFSANTSILNAKLKKKSIEIAEVGTYTIYADEGFDGISKLTITIITKDKSTSIT